MKLRFGEVKFWSKEPGFKFANAWFLSSSMESWHLVYNENSIVFMFSTLSQLGKLGKAEIDGSQVYRNEVG